MAAAAAPSPHGNKLIRLRLFFDYPPPAAVGCRMCWLLVDLAACRVVADLESVIREKFEFSRGSILSLFIDDCYLPHTESVYVVRDNDSVRVKVECLAQVNGHSSRLETADVGCRKRRRDTGEDGAGVVAEHKKKKKKKKKSEDGTADRTKLAKTESSSKSSEAKEAATKSKKKEKSAVKSASHKPSSPKKKKTKQPNAAPSDSSSSKDEASQKKVAKKPSSTPAASKEPTQVKTSQKKSKPSSSSSSEASSSDEADRLKAQPKPGVLSPSSRSRAPQAEQKQEEPPHSEEEIQLVIRRPQPPGLNIAGLGRGRDWRKAGGGGRGQSDGEGSSNGPQRPSYHSDSLTNRSVVLQNEAEPAPQRDYGSMPLLAGPPQVGQKIAFKLLELTENYTPEVSEYKEGKIVKFDPTTKQIELELLCASQAPAEPGKFDLVYQNPDGSERVEYAVQRGTSVTERWESLLEPRLII